MAIYRIWSYDSNDRSEIGRIKALNFETVQDFILYSTIKPEYRKDITETDIGFELITCNKEECLENNQEENEDSICDLCSMPSIYGIEIQEYQDSEIEQEYKTILGTNEYWNLTLKTVKPLLRKIDKLKNLMQKKNLSAFNENFERQISDIWEKIDKISKACDWSLMPTIIKLSEQIDKKVIL